MNTSKPNLFVDLTLEFALEVIDHVEFWQEKKKFNKSNQLFKSGTSIGANVNEAKVAKADPTSSIK